MSSTKEIRFAQLVKICWKHVSVSLLLPTAKSRKASVESNMT